MPGPGSEVALFSIAYRFADFDAAGRAYEQSRDLIFAAYLNASTYRVVLNGITHVVVIGEDVPFPTLQQARMLPSRRVKAMYTSSVIPPYQFQDPLAGPGPATSLVFSIL